VSLQREAQLQLNPTSSCTPRNHALVAAGRTHEHALAIITIIIHLFFHMLTRMLTAGPEVTAEAVRVLETITKHTDLEITLESKDFGGIAIDNHGEPLPDDTLKSCMEADAILLGESVCEKFGLYRGASRCQKRWTWVRLMAARIDMSHCTFTQKHLFTSTSSIRRKP
jgi:hypothetical protein